MVGNDIVDLGDEETRERTLHPHFDARVFTELERDALAASSDRHLLRWSLWAAKESAFKLAKREDPLTVFAHRRFEVRLSSDGWGQVQHGGESWVVRLYHHDDAIHVLCTDTRGSARTLCHSLALRASQESPSAAARALACRELAAVLQVPVSELSIDSTPERFPVLRIGNGLAPGRLSLSHHGRFVAYAYRP